MLKVRLGGAGRDVYDDVLAGVEAVFESLTSPCEKILTNAGYEVKVLEKLKEGEGINVETGKQVDLVKVGIIDPTKVVRSALQNASSVAGMILTTDVLVANSKEDINKATNSLTQQ